MIKAYRQLECRIAVLFAAMEPGRSLRRAPTQPAILKNRDNCEKSFTAERHYLTIPLVV
jgi:hypothetical protein